MAVQSGYGRIGFDEDFLGLAPTLTISDATPIRYNQIGIVALSGDADMAMTVDEPNGVASFTGAGGAADGVALFSAPMQPSTNGTIWVEARMKASVVSDLRIFCGFESTFLQTEPVLPFTLSGTTLTANNSGEAAGIYFDAQATTDDFRFLSSTAGTADLAATVRDGKGNLTSFGTLGVRANATAAADSYFILRVEMDNDGTVRAFVGDESMNVKGPKLIATLAGGTMTTTSLYFPVLHLACHSTGDPLYEVDYFRGGGNRDWTI
jgi:hypothetical protein